MVHLISNSSQANSVDPDQTPRIARLIWVYMSVNTCFVEMAVYML